MPWLKIDDQFPGHRKVRRLSDSAFRLHTTALCACAHDLTDGKVTREDIEDMPGVKKRYVERSISDLTRAKVWQIRDEDGTGVWWIHDYLDYNPSRAEVMAGREQARIRQQKWKEKHVEAKSNAVTNASTNASPNASPTLPRSVPFRSVPSTTPAAADDGFNEWWAIYPHKVAKGAATKAYKAALKKTDAATLLSSITAQLAWFASCIRNGEDFRPHPASWLNGERWNDRPSQVTPIRTRSAATPEGW